MAVADVPQVAPGAQPGAVPGTEREILRRAAGGQRLSAADALSLLEHGDLERIGEVADAIRRRRFPEGYATFIVDRNINYTNVCVVKCSFCAFYRLPGHEEGYRRTPEEIFQRVEEALDRGATQIMFQGGHDPKLTITYYEDLLSSVKARYPVTLHSLSPSEVHHIARYSRLSIAETLRRLKAAGLELPPRRGRRDPLGAGQAGHQPPQEQRRGLDRDHGRGPPAGAAHDRHHDAGPRGDAGGARRALPARARLPGPGPARRRDRARATAPSSPGRYQPDHTELAALAPGRTTSEDYLKTLAVSRLFFDNIDHIQGSWLTVGKAVGQRSLALGADDLGSIMLEENVVSAAGVTEKCLTDEAMIALIREAGRIPALRDTSYRVIRTY